MKIGRDKIRSTLQVFGTAVQQMYAVCMTAMYLSRRQNDLVKENRVLGTSQVLIITKLSFH